MVFKFLGIGKKSKFVLEAPPIGSEPADQAAEPTQAKVVAAPEPSHTEAKVAAPAVEKNGKKPATSGKTLKEVNAEKRAKAENVKAKADPKAAKVDPKVDPKAVPEVAVPAPKVEPVLTNFATTMQLNSTPRRRPGPSLNVFKDMAKQVNTKK
jgi:hypothetical protein